MTMFIFLLTPPSQGSFQQRGLDGSAMVLTFPAEAGGTREVLRDAQGHHRQPAIAGTTDLVLHSIDLQIINDSDLPRKGPQFGRRFT